MSSDVDTWILPGDLTRNLQDGRPRRTTRDWVVDSIVFVGCVALWAAEAFRLVEPTHTIAWLHGADLVGGALLCVAVWWRREFPIAFGLAAAVVGAFSNSAFGALLVALFSLALHRGWRWGYGVTAGMQVLGLPYILIFFPAGQQWVWAAFIFLALMLMTTAGLAVRARRQLVRVLAQRAEDARREQVRQVADAQGAERRRIAGEMHDVLAHRLSLLAVHAGALEYRIGAAPPGSVPDEIAQSVAVIRESAHLSLEELREVLQVLRAADVAGDGRGDGRGAPAPTIAAIPALVAEAREAGQRVALTLAGTELRPVPLPVQRTVYRVVQEGLTNARKHAPGSAVDVVVQVSLGGGPRIEVEVSNPVAPGISEAELPGAGSGQTGLGERAAHHGGTVTHTVTDGRYVLCARVPLVGPVEGWAP